MDAKQVTANDNPEDATRLDRRIALPLVAALAAGLLLALAEAPATAQSQLAGGVAPAAPAAVLVEPPLAGDAAAGMPAASMPADPEPAVMEPGDYDWHPERSLAGDVVIVVSLPQQLVHVYRGGVRIGMSTISSGRPGHDTPTGVFTILQKQKMHHSTLYDDAAMPFMQRLTWDGVAMHAGRLPGYPATHGCIRLPAAFAEALYGVTDHGGLVVVADDTTFADDIVRPGDEAPSDLLALEPRASEDESLAMGMGAAASP
jgi:hypothetical protein